MIVAGLSDGKELAKVLLGCQCSTFSTSTRLCDSDFSTGSQYHIYISPHHESSRGQKHKGRY